MLERTRSGTSSPQAPGNRSSVSGTGNALPQVEHSQFSRPASDVLAIEILPYGQDAGNILELFLGLPRPTRPFQLGQDGVLRSGKRHAQPRKELAPLAPAEFGLAEGPLLAHDQV